MPAARAAGLSVCGFPRTERLLRRGQYLRVQNGGRRVHTAHFVILVLPRGVQGDAQGPATARIGVTVGKRVGNAVRRNRVKRVVREVYRTSKTLFPTDCDVVLVARLGADRLDYGAVKAEVERARDAIFEARTKALARDPRPPQSSL